MNITSIMYKEIVGIEPDPFWGWTAFGILVIITAYCLYYLNMSGFTPQIGDKK